MHVGNCYAELICISSVSFFFFFKQRTAYELRISDWSSDVCSSDLLFRLEELTARLHRLFLKRAADRMVGDIDPGRRQIAHQLANHVVVARFLDRKSTRLNSSH